MADKRIGAAAPIPAAVRAAVPQTDIAPASALNALEDKLCGLRNELFDVAALLVAIRARLDQLYDQDQVDGNINDELGRLIALAAREVERLASDEAVGGAA